MERPVVGLLKAITLSYKNPLIRKSLQKLVRVAKCRAGVADETYACTLPPFDLVAVVGTLLSRVISKWARCNSMSYYQLQSS